MSKNSIVNDRSEHIDIKYQFLIDKIKRETVSVEFISTSDMIADNLTKALPRDKFQRFVKLMSIKLWNIS